MRRVAVGLIAALLLTGCSTNTENDVESSSAPPEPTEVSTVVASPAVPDPKPPIGPAATTSASLSEADLIVPAGWDKFVGEGSQEEGYLGNGTWVHEVDPVLRGDGVLAVGCTAEPPGLAGRVPVGALEGTLHKHGRPGISLALQFKNDTAAADYFAAWIKELEACSPPMVEKVEKGEQYWLGRRDIDGTWSEVGILDGSVTRFLIVNEDMPDDELRRVLDDA